MASRESLLGIGSEQQLNIKSSSSTSTTQTSRSTRLVTPPIITETAVWLFFMQVLAVAAYLICALVLPPRIEIMSEATHIAALHGALSVLLAVLAVIISRTLDNMEYTPAYYPITVGIADTPVYVVWMVNALLLVFLGVESWLQSELGDDGISIMALVQFMAGLELFSVLIPALMAGYRWIQYRKLQGNAGGMNGALLAMNTGTTNPNNTNISSNNGGRNISSSSNNGTNSNNSSKMFQIGGATSSSSPFPIQRSLSRQDMTPLSRKASFIPEEANAANENTASGNSGNSNNNSNNSSSSSSTNTFISPQQVLRLSERVRVLEKKEDHLLREMRNMAAELAKALASSPSASAISIDTATINTDNNSAEATANKSGGGGGGVADIAGLLRNAMDDITRLSEDNRKLSQRCSELEERGTYIESELRRAAGDVQKLRTALKEEKRIKEKLFSTLDVEREANAQAQNAIGELRGRVSMSGGTGSGGGNGMGSAASSFRDAPTAAIFIQSPAPGGGGGRGSFSSAMNNNNNNNNNNLNMLSRSPGSSSYFQTPGKGSILMPSIADNDD